MAGRRIGTDTLAMRSDVNAIKDDLDSMRSALTRIYNDVADLDRMWDGRANSTFNQQFARDRELFEEFCKSIETLADSMDKARGEYERCEADVANTISAIRIGR